MGAGFCSAENFTGDDAKNERGGNCQQQGRAYGHTYLSLGKVGLLFRRPLRGGEGEAQVVGCGQSGIQKTNDRQPDCVAANRGGKRIELAEESTGKGDAHE